MSYERAYISTLGDEYFTEMLENLNKYHDHHSQRLFSKNFKEDVLRFMEEEGEEIERDINNITCDT